MSVPFSVDIEAGFVSESEQGIQGVTSGALTVAVTYRDAYQSLLMGVKRHLTRRRHSITFYLFKVPTLVTLLKKTATSIRRSPASGEPMRYWRVGNVVWKAYSSLCVFPHVHPDPLRGGLTIPSRQSGLFSATVSLFVIESYKRVSSDAVDQAADLFDKVSHLVGIPAGISPKPTLPSSLDAASFEPSSSAVCAITLWLLSLSLNIACVLWMLWQQWRQQSTDSDSSTQGSEPHARVRAGHSSRVGPVAMGHIMKVIWVLLRASALLFLVGLAKFIPPIDTAVPWFPLGYLSLLALLYAVRVLLVVACQVFSGTCPRG